MFSWDGELNHIVKGIAMGKKTSWSLSSWHGKKSSASELAKSLGSEIIYWVIKVEPSDGNNSG